MPSESQARSAVAAALDKLKVALEQQIPAKIRKGQPSGCSGFQIFRGIGGYPKFFDIRFNVAPADKNGLKHGDTTRPSTKRMQTICHTIASQLGKDRCYICELTGCEWHGGRSDAVREAESSLAEAAADALRFTLHARDLRPRTGSKSVQATAAQNRLEAVARFQCQWSGQGGAGGSVPLLVNFAFGADTETVERLGQEDRFTFDLRHAYLRVELHRGILQALDAVDFEKAPGETADCQLHAKRDRGGIEYFARWRLSGGANLTGRFGFEPVGYAEFPDPKDKAFLQIDASDIRVRLLDGEQLESDAARDVAKQWLRLKQILNDSLPSNGVLTISEQPFDDD